MIIQGEALEKDFVKWFRARGDYYAKLSLRHYVDGEPYFASEGAECSLRNFLQVRDRVKDIFTCYYVSGGGADHDAGLWQKKETPKTLTFEYIDDLHFKPLFTKIKINKFYSKRKPRKDGNYNAYRDLEESGIQYRGWANNGNVIRDWLDGTYTAYPGQAGTPYIFEPIKPEKIDEVIKQLNKEDKRV